jgi:hypothetical protein
VVNASATTQTVHQKSDAGRIVFGWNARRQWHQKTYNRSQVSNWNTWNLKENALRHAGGLKSWHFDDLTFMWSMQMPPLKPFIKKAMKVISSSDEICIISEQFMLHSVRGRLFLRDGTTRQWVPLGSTLCCCVSLAVLGWGPVS